MANFPTKKKRTFPQKMVEFSISPLLLCVDTVEQKWHQNWSAHLGPFPSFSSSSLPTILSPPKPHRPLYPSLPHYHLNHHSLSGRKGREKFAPILKSERDFFPVSSSFTSVPYSCTTSVDHATYTKKTLKNLCVFSQGILAPSNTHFLNPPLSQSKLIPELFLLFSHVEPTNCCRSLHHTFLCFGSFLLSSLCHHLSAAETPKGGGEGGG